MLFFERNINRNVYGTDYRLFDKFCHSYIYIYIYIRWTYYTWWLHIVFLHGYTVRHAKTQTNIALVIWAKIHKPSLLTFLPVWQDVHRTHQKSVAIFPLLFSTSGNIFTTTVFYYISSHCPIGTTRRLEKISYKWRIFVFGNIWNMYSVHLIHLFRSLNQCYKQASLCRRLPGAVCNKKSKIYLKCFLVNHLELMTTG